MALFDLIKNQLENKMGTEKNAARGARAERASLTGCDYKKKVLQSACKSAPEEKESLCKSNSAKPVTGTVYPHDTRASTWDSEVQALIEWFRHTELPEAPFHIYGWGTVTDWRRFRAALLRDAEAGPGGPRGRVLPGDLRKLYAVLEGAQ